MLDVYKFIQELQNKHGVWTKLAETIGIDQTQAHNYYHNTWTRQFHHSTDEYKQELNDLVQQQRQLQKSKSKVVNEVRRLFTNKHPDKDFHQSHLSQLLYKLYDRPIKPEVIDIKQFLKYGK
uniref:Uncharacterized protein n=1 Tax=Trepomonas sp. PC1 TaxID=1076344 RepID=A0A146KK41_9EUKA|eukprot:JAP95801.1 Hypothetical protein TPC1_11076 [Trepomonas sp. PC1]